MGVEWNCSTLREIVMSSTPNPEYWETYTVKLGVLCTKTSLLVGSGVSSCDTQRSLITVHIAAECLTANN